MFAILCQNAFLKLNALRIALIRCKFGRGNHNLYSIKYYSSYEIFECLLCTICSLVEN